MVTTKRNGKIILKRKPDGFGHAPRISVSITAEHDKLLDHLKDETGYSKTQLVCMAISYFSEHVEVQP